MWLSLGPIWVAAQLPGTICKKNKLTSMTAKEIFINMQRVYNELQSFREFQGMIHGPGRTGLRRP
jgi:hypothetical protein